MSLPHHLKQQGLDAEARMTTTETELRRSLTMEAHQTPQTSAQRMHWKQKALLVPVLVLLGIVLILFAVLLLRGHDGGKTTLGFAVTVAGVRKE